jgi:hypothetical protein
MERGNNTIRFSYIVLVLIVSTRVLCGSGSAYSLFGVGEMRYFPSERSAGMGGSHIALLGTGAINAFNPAAWTSIKRVRFSISTTYDGYTISDASNSTFLSKATFNGVSAAIPISMDRGIVTSFGLTPYSVVNYDVVTSETGPSSTTYTLKQVGEGGLTTAYVGLSSAFAQQWHIGAKFNYLFGTLHHNTSQEFQSSNGFTNAHLDRAIRLNGITFTVGAIYSGVGNLFNVSESHAITIGAMFTTGSKLTTTQENFYEYTFSGSTIGRDTVTVSDGASTLPFAFGVGMSYASKEQFIVAADLYYQNWDRFDILGVHPAELRNSYRASLGAEILPRRDAAATYWERASYQFGFFYDATNLRIKGKDINEFGLTGGIGLPMFGETRLTLSAAYSLRGTLDIEKDNIIRVTLTLNTGELWFVRPAEEE